MVKMSWQKWQTSLAHCATAFLITHSLLAKLELLPGSGLPQTQDKWGPPLAQGMSAHCSMPIMASITITYHIHRYQIWHLFPSLVTGLGMGYDGTWTMNGAKRKVFFCPWIYLFEDMMPRAVSAMLWPGGTSGKI